LLLICPDRKVISPQDIATYGCICALASFDRIDLKNRILENQNFRQFLELTPQFRKIIEDFYQSKYTSCLQGLEQIKSELQLDIHLHDHVAGLFQEIRKRALIQYFSPFLSVDMNKMAATFNVSNEQVLSFAWKGKGKGKGKG